MRPWSMGLAIAMFSLCAGRARELSSRYVYGNGGNVAWETRNGISRTWSVGEDKLKTFRRQKHHPLMVRYETDLVHLVLVARKPADAGKTSRPVHAGDQYLCRKCIVSRRTLRSMMGQRCRVYHCCRHTMVSKLKLDHNEVPRAFVQKNRIRRSVLPKSLRTHPDHTPM